MKANQAGEEYWVAKSSLVCSKIFPGTVQQFRAQMQRLSRFAAVNWGREIFLDGIDPGIQGGLWKSSEDCLLLFEEVRKRQYPPGAKDEPTLIPASEMEEYLDITPSTRSTWAVYRLQRKTRVTDPAEAPDSYERIGVIHCCSDIEGEYEDQYEYQERSGGFAGIEAYERHDGTSVDFLDGYDPVRIMDLDMPGIASPIGCAFEEFCEWVIRELWGEGDNVPEEPLREKLYQDRLIKIRRILVERFDDEELRTLCFDLGVNYDNLPGKGRKGKARDLVAWLDRHRQIGNLVKVARQHRQDIAWSEILENKS